MSQSKLKILISFILLTNFVVGQVDTLNKYNSKGQRNGYWKVFLDECSNVIKDSSNAYFYGYELWDNGEKAFFFCSHSRKDKMSFVGPQITKGRLIPISGTLKWFDKKGRLSLEERFKDGHPVRFMSYLNKNKTDTTAYLFEDLDYMKKYNNIPGTAFIQIHSIYNNPVKNYWFRKGEKGWRAYSTN